jgi:hypothetical protein
MAKGQSAGSARIKKLAGRSQVTLAAADIRDRDLAFHWTDFNRLGVSDCQNPSCFRNARHHFPNPSNALFHASDELFTFI